MRRPHIPEKLKVWVMSRVSAILVGGQFAVNAWVWAIPTSHMAAKIVCAFFLGWSLVLMIQTLLLDQDIKNIDRDIKRIEHETEMIRLKTDTVRRMNNAWIGKPVSVQIVRETGPLL